MPKLQPPVLEWHGEFISIVDGQAKCTNREVQAIANDLLQVIREEYQVHFGYRDQFYATGLQKFGFKIHVMGTIPYSAGRIY